MAEEKHGDFGVVQSQRNEILPEEFPEGPYGSLRNESRLGKSAPWEEGQRSKSAYTYETREAHEDLQRLVPGAHPLHDDPEE